MLTYDSAYGAQLEEVPVDLCSDVDSDVPSLPRKRRSAITSGGTAFVRCFDAPVRCEANCRRDLPRACPAAPAHGRHETSLRRQHRRLRGDGLRNPPPPRRQSGCAICNVHDPDTDLPNRESPAGVAHNALRPMHGRCRLASSHLQVDAPFETATLRQATARCSWRGPNTAHALGEIVTLARVATTPCSRYCQGARSAA